MSLPLAVPIGGSAMARTPTTGTAMGRSATLEVTYPAKHLSAVHLVHSEISAVTSAMRRHQRFTASSSFLGGGGSAAADVAGPVAGGSAAAGMGRQAAAMAINSLTASLAAPVPNGAPGGSSRAPSAPSTPSAELGLSASLGLRSANGTKAKFGATKMGSSRDEGIPGLLNGFTVLRAQLREVQDISALPVPLLVSPFLRTILSPRTTGPITSTALQAIHRFLIYGIVRLPAPPSPASQRRADKQPEPSATETSTVGVQTAIAEIAHAVSHCRFEASDAATDELVLLRILAVMRELVCAPDGVAMAQLHGESGDSPRRPLADCLSDESICELMETGLSMCCQLRLTDFLRRTAEQSVTSMARALFSRLRTLPTSVDEAYSSDPNAPPPEPEHATLAADPVGPDALDTDKEKRLRRITMPDPSSRAFPAAAANVLAELKEMGEKEEAAETESGEAAVSEKAESEAKAEETDQKAEEDGPAAPGAQEEASPDELALLASMQTDIVPYGLPAVREVLRVVVSLLDSQNQQHTDTMRMLGLSLLTSIFEVSSGCIARFPSLRAIVQDSACKHLFQLARSEHPAIMTFSLRAISTLFETMRDHLKLQYETLLIYLLDRLAPTFPLASEPWNEDNHTAVLSRRGSLGDVASRRSPTPDSSGGGQTAPPPPPPPPPPATKSSNNKAPAFGEARELMLEMLSMLLRGYAETASAPGGGDAISELFINFDCDTDCENVLERLIHFLCRAVYASNPLHPSVQDGSQVVALDLLLKIVAAMTARQEAVALGEWIESPWPGHLPEPEELLKQKSRKAAILAGAARFNAKPKDGLAYLEKEGFIDTSGANGVSRAESIARFLKDCPRLDKRLLGDYISRQENLEILEAFISLFDFKERPVAEAMRELLESFRLPGEAQQIARITETFAKIYFAAGPLEIASEDAVYVLAYSIIMLNTDLHNANIRKRMAVDDYRRNLRGVNDGKDFDPEYLAGIYDSIRRREIVMPEEHKGQLGFEYEWKELLRRSRTCGDFVSPCTAIFDKAMFESSWQPIVATIAHAFSTFRDEHLLERAISGFRQCAVLASRFGMVELFDFMCSVLAGATGLLDAKNGANSSSGPATAVVEVEGSPITVSPLSVRFGMNFKGQLAAVVLFTIANGNCDVIREGWEPIFEILKNLFVNSLLPSDMTRMQDFTSDEANTIPLKPKKAAGAAAPDPRAQSGGLFSTLSSYLLSPYSSGQESQSRDVTDDDVESTLCTVDCVASCRVEDLHQQMLHLGPESLEYAVRALRALCDRCTVDRLSAPAAQPEPVRMLREQGSNSGRSTPIQSPLAISERGQLPYDPRAVFGLETMVAISESATGATLKECWTIVSGHITALLRRAGSFHPLQVERAVACLLKLIAKTSLDPSADVRDQIFLSLDLIRSLPAESKAAVSLQVISGLRYVLRTNPDLAKSQKEWSLVLSLLAESSTARDAKIVSASVEAAHAFAGRATTRDNLSAVLSLLKDFLLKADTSAWKLEEQRSSIRRTLTEKKELADYEVACQERGVKALAALEELRTALPRLVDLENPAGAIEDWKNTWTPLLVAIAHQLLHPHRPIRSAALAAFQRALLSPELIQLGEAPASLEQQQAMIHHSLLAVLFPTMDELLKPEVLKMDEDPGPGGIPETRVRACGVLSKVLLHHLTPLTADGPGEAFRGLWTHVLGCFLAYMQASKKDQVSESVPEILKNVLLVMNASGLLLPPPRPAADAAAQTAPSEEGSEAKADEAAMTEVEDTRTSDQRALYDLTVQHLDPALLPFANVAAAAAASKH